MVLSHANVAFSFSPSLSLSLKKKVENKNEQKNFVYSRFLQDTFLIELITTFLCLLFIIPF